MTAVPNMVIGKSLGDDDLVAVDPIASQALSLGISVEVMEKASDDDLALLRDVRTESWSVGIEQWIQDNSSRYDPTLLGSFMYVMRKRQMHAARAQQFLATFLKWKDEAPSAE